MTLHCRLHARSAVAVPGLERVLLVGTRRALELQHRIRHAAHCRPAVEQRHSRHVAEAATVYVVEPRACGTSEPCAAARGHVTTLETRDL